MNITESSLVIPNVDKLYSYIPVDEQTGKRQIFIDASALKNGSCFRHLWWTAVDGYQLNDSKDHRLAFGSAIHIFLEDLYKGLDRKAAVTRAVDYYAPYNATLNLTPYEFRTTTNLIKICKAYMEEYNSNFSFNMDFNPLKDKDGKPLVEYKFAIPIWANRQIDLLLSGTIDLVSEYHSIPLVLADHKTSAMTMDEKFFNPYDWDIQPMLYSKVWKEANGLDYYPPFIINGIGCKKPTQKAEKEGVFDGAVFKRSGIIEYTESQMKWFDTWISRQLHKIIANLTLHGNNYDASRDYNMAACKSIYGHCKYFGVCKLPIERQADKLAASYSQNHYNPLKFRD